MPPKPAVIAGGGAAMISIWAGGVYWVNDSYPNVQRSRAPSIVCRALLDERILIMTIASNATMNRRKGHQHTLGKVHRGLFVTVRHPPG
jgi:hypothetical protein